MNKINVIFLVGLLSTSIGFTNKVIQINCYVTDKNISEHQVDHLPAYKEYDSILSLSAEMNKPILLYFTGHNVVNAKKMDMRVLNDRMISAKMKENFIVLELYVDDRTELQKEQWITNTKTKKVMKTIGEQNQYIESIKFNQNTQPFFVILDSEENVYGKTGYVPSIENFDTFLDESFERFKK